MGSDKVTGKAPHIQEVLIVAKTLGLKRNGESTADFAKKTIQTAALRCKIDRTWALQNEEVSAFVSRFSGFDPEEHRSIVAFTEPDDYLQELPIYILSQAKSLLREYGEF